MITLNINNADQFVDKLQDKGVDVRWEGWTMVFFNPDRKALRSKYGRRLGSEWGFETTVEPNSSGEWLLKHSWTKVRHGRG